MDYCVGCGQKAYGQCVRCGATWCFWHFTYGRGKVFDSHGHEATLDVPCNACGESVISDWLSSRNSLSWLECSVELDQAPGGGCDGFSWHKIGAWAEIHVPLDPFEMRVSGLFLDRRAQVRGWRIVVGSDAVFLREDRRWAKEPRRVFSTGREYRDWLKETRAFGEKPFFEKLADASDRWFSVNGASPSSFQGRPRNVRK